MKKLIIVLFVFIQSIAYAQSDKENKDPDVERIDKLRLSITQNPNDLSLHEKYLAATGFAKWGAKENPDFLKQYEEWMLKFPNSAIIPYALGYAYASKESPKAKPYLLKAVEIDPTFSKAYFYLWIDGQRWGDFDRSREYLRKAMETDLSNPDYAFYYRSSFKNVDPERYQQGMLEMPKLFPDSERGAQSLYWLGIKVNDINEKIAIYTQLKNAYPPEKSRWSLSGMYDFFYTYLEQNPGKALELAQSIASLPINESYKKDWDDRAKFAQDLIQVKKLLDKNKAPEALVMLDAISLERRSATTKMIALLKAEVADIAGETEIAYEQLINYYAPTPNDGVLVLLKKYANKLGKDNGGMFEDIWKLRDAQAVEVTPCSLDLETYFGAGKTSLSDYKGKVVLVTYWFPGCGPCRGEFPNFENVIKKFNKENIAYLGINMTPEQDEYVVPFMKSSGYSFTPLKGEDDKRGNLVARGAPTNYLLDQDGRIMFKKFRIDHRNERMLELMINELLERHSAK